MVMHFLWSAYFCVYLCRNKYFFVFLFIREVMKVEENTETPTIEDAAENEPETVVPTNEQATTENVPAATNPVTAEEDELIQRLDELIQILTEKNENPQLYNTIYTTDDYVITLMHEITLGDFLISMLLCVLIVVKVVSAVLGGGRRW